MRQGVHEDETGISVFGMTNISVLDRDSDRNLSCGGGAIWLTGS